MAIIISDTFHHAAKFAVWKVEEPDAFYASKLILSPAEIQFIEKIRHPKKKTDWLASRYLIKYLMQTNSFVELLADENGKPYITNFDYHISISHCENYVAVILSQSFHVGIDIEDISRDISLLRHKFLSPKEIAEMGSDKNIQQLIYWASKEVMYKIYSKRKLEFKDHMYLFPFETNKSGLLIGELRKDQNAVLYQMHYLFLESFVLVIGIHI